MEGKERGEFILELNIRTEERRIRLLWSLFLSYVGTKSGGFVLGINVFCVCMHV